jgi:hypothetical protein
LEEAIVPDRFWSLAEPCVEPAPPTNPNAILSAIATALIRLVVMEHVSGIGIWRMGLRDPRFKRQNTLGLGVRCRNLCQLQNRRDMCPILLT